MDIKALDQGLAVSGQIAATDLQAIAEAGESTPLGEGAPHGEP